MVFLCDNLFVTYIQNLAAQNFSSDGGLLIELCKYKQNMVNYFDCARISPYDHEQEMFFFGGDTLLRIKTIKHFIAPVRDYKYFIEAIEGIKKFMNGMKIHNKMI